MLFRSLLKNKIDISTVRDKGHASLICDAIIARIKARLSTPAQARYAEALGLAGAFNRSFEDVSHFISETKAGRSPLAELPEI